MHADAARLIADLRLEPLPQEGGYFRQTWCGASGSAILFLLTPEDFSAVHRLAQDEVWHFYAGDAVEHLQLNPNTGETGRTRLGGDLRAGGLPQLAVPRNIWQGARIAPGQNGGMASERGFALLGCTVTPPWDPTGFELGQRDHLVRQFPREAERIRALTR